MITKSTLKEIARLQREDLSLMDVGIERESISRIDMKLPFALILSGIRRSGKSTLMRQLMKKTKNFYYFNFEDPRAVDFSVNDFQRLDEVFKEEYGRQEYYFFDEIQNVPKWELFVRKLIDSKNHVIITGSNASLLSKELGTRLTGRHINYEIFPFSFQEFLNLKNKNANITSFQEYLFEGGFPEYLKTKSSEVLQELLRDIVIRDISTRYKIRNIKTLKEMAVYLLTNVGKEFSYNSLKNIFKLGSTNSAITFISYFEDSYMLFTVSRFDYSLKKRLVNPKKVYSIDNGLSRTNSASFCEDKGRMLENMVFLNLRKNYKDIFYFQEKNECDFVIREGLSITKAIQICYDFNEENKEREISGLLEAMKKFKLKEGLILTYNQEDELKFDNMRIILKPVWKWLLTQ